MPMVDGISLQGSVNKFSYPSVPCYEKNNLENYSAMNSIGSSTGISEK